MRIPGDDAARHEDLPPGLWFGVGSASVHGEERGHLIVVPDQGGSVLPCTLAQTVVVCASATPSQPPGMTCSPSSYRLEGYIKTCCCSGGDGGPAGGDDAAPGGDAAPDASAG